jgi:SAM-dependent methyltransferase
VTGHPVTACPALYCRVMSTPPFDTAEPNVARMYDYWLGGTDNYEADREAAEAVRRVRPNVAEQALDNKRFQTRAVTYVAGHGVRQFLDVGSGLPTSPVLAPGAEPQWLATHEAARRVMPDAMVAYIDHDPAAVQHSRALLHSRALGDDLHGVVATAGDMGDPKAILADDEIRAAGFDLDAPACVVLACVLHFVDAETAHGIASTFARALAPGSYLVISVGFGRGREGTDFASTYNAQAGPVIYSHTREEITGLFDGLELVPPGIVETSAWRPGQPETMPEEHASMIVAGVGRRLLAAGVVAGGRADGGGVGAEVGHVARVDLAPALAPRPGRRAVEAGGQAL